MRLIQLLRGVLPKKFGRTLLLLFDYFWQQLPIIFEAGRKKSAIADRAAIQPAIRYIIVAWCLIHEILHRGLALVTVVNFRLLIIFSTCGILIHDMWRLMLVKVAVQILLQVSRAIKHLYPDLTRTLHAAELWVKAS